MKNKMIALGTLLLLLDQVVKVIADNLLNNTIIIIPNFIQLQYLKNYGVGFSMLNGNRFLIIIISVILIYFAVTLVREYSGKPKYLLGLTLILAGAFGNLIDRIVRGYVVDYVDTYIFGYDFPVFNLADVYLCIGAIGIIILLILDEKKGK